MAEQGRGRANMLLCRQIESRTLDQLRRNEGITMTTHTAEEKKKRRKVPVVPQQQDMGHNDFVEDTLAVDENFVLDLQNLGAICQTIPGAEAPAPTAVAAAASLNGSGSNNENEDDGGGEQFAPE